MERVCTAEKFVNKVKIFLKIVASILLYHFESWTATEKHRNKIKSVNF